MLDQDNNFYLITLNILITCLISWIMYEYYRKRLHINYLKELKGQMRQIFSLDILLK